MKTPAPARIPIPWRRRWHDARMRVIPVVVFLAAMVMVGFLWEDFIAAPTLVGQAEPVRASVSSYKPGVLAELNVTRFKFVKAGDPVGRVLVSDPRLLASSLAVIQAEIEVLRATMEPIAAQQRTAISFNRLRLDWMDQRARLATSRVNLQFAEAEFGRNEELFNQKLVSQSVYELARATRVRYRGEVAELSSLVKEMEQNSSWLQLTNTMDLSKVSEDPLRTAIALQESRLRLTESELSPITLLAPVDGMVDLVYHRSGEAVTAGEPIVMIATEHSVRIVGYLRAPILHEPKVGMTVQVRTRGPTREVGSATILEIGTQMEPIAAALQPPVRVANVDLGLALSISLPANVRIRPGELVDLTLYPTTD